MPRRKQTDWMGWAKTFGAPMLGLIGVLVAFYFTTNATLNEHSRQFAEVKEQFKQFNATLKANYEDYAKNQKEEAATREKLREQFMTTFGKLNENSAAAKVQIDNIGKQLDAITHKVDTINTTTQNSSGGSARSR